METQINGQLWLSSLKSNPKLCCLQNVELQGFLFLFPSLILMNGGLDHEVGLREMKKNHALTMENEGEEEGDERESVFSDWVSSGQFPF